MNSLLAALLGAALATNQPVALSNLVAERTGVALPVSNPNDPVEKEFARLMEKDNEAQAEVDEWITEERRFDDKGAPLSEGVLRQRIKQRLDGVENDYADFMQRHPKHSRARIAYGSFLNDIGEENRAREQWEKAAAQDPNIPAVWNNLANYWGHNGDVKKAFGFYEKALSLSPNEPVYFQNLATTVYLFRKDAKEFYQIPEQEVFDKAMGLYRKALSLDPKNFPLATDLAQTYYGIQPLRAHDALVAWTNAFQIARDDIEREGVQIHFARVKINAGRPEEARQHLAMVNEKMYDVTKGLLLRKLNKDVAPGTNATVNAVPAEKAGDVQVRRAVPSAPVKLPVPPPASE